METDGSFKRLDTYARVTDEIVRVIEDGVKEYKMPWHQGTGAMLPRNALTSNFYRGINTVALWASSRRQGFGLPYWASFLQWQKLDARIRRGEKASVVVFYKQDDPAPDNDEDDSQQHGRKQRIVLKSSFVFNAEQVDGWSPPDVPYEDQTEKLARIDAFIESLGSDVRYGGTVAAYNMNLDRIRMPERSQFVGSDTRTATESFYSVLLHEHVHWTGHPKRLNRRLSGRFGDHVYAMEELVAEIGAAFLCAELGISVHPRPDHASYVSHWLSLLRRENRAIFLAAHDARAASLYLQQIVAYAA